MTEFYKKEDVIAFLNLHCPKDMWEYQIADLNTVKVMEYADAERPRAFGAGYKAGYDNASKLVRCKDCMLNTVNTDGATEPWCYKFGYAVEDTDFCSYGERIE